ncbi:MAG: threonine synthase, partial [Acholeplasmataceae bacterium]
MYTSTREKLEKHASDVILKGLSDEGGLFILENLDDSVYSNIVQTSYHDIAYQVFSYFLDDYPKHMIESIIEKSYGHAFNPYIVGLNSTQKMTLMTLYHGPTFAFKDIALQALPHMYDYAKKIQGDNRKTIILTATSGDTGGAALDGFSKLADTIIIILYPTLGVSEFQQKQMKSYQSDSCYVFGIDGDFDDCQHIVKTLFQELELK